MTQRRAIPTFAPETFRDWFERRPQTGGTGEKVVLWPDTFNDYFYSDTARAAAEVLEALGFDVVVPRKKLCCGRPLYDYGMLDTAKLYLERILRVMQPHLAAGTPIVVLEPSCASVFRDELPNLMPQREAGKRLTAQTFLLSEFLIKHAADRLPRLERRAIVQGHCHHKSVLGFDAQKQLFEKMGLDVRDPHRLLWTSWLVRLRSGKYQISSDCGERVILPEVRRAADEVFILADGFSCRTQIEQGTGRRALHLAEALKLALESTHATPAARPEHEVAARRDSAVARSIRRARVATVSGLLAIAGVAAYLASRRRN